MGVPIEEPSYCFTDNQSVLKNATTPESTLKKKSNSISYHYVRECVAKQEISIAYINTDDNPADILTKVLPDNKRKMKLIKKLMWDL